MGNPNDKTMIQKLAGIIGYIIGYLELLTICLMIITYLEAHEKGNLSPLLKSVVKLYSSEMHLMAISIILSSVLWICGVHRKQQIFFFVSGLLCVWLFFSGVMIPITRIYDGFHNFVSRGCATEMGQVDAVKNISLAIISTKYLMWVCLKFGLYNGFPIIQKIYKSTKKFCIDSCFKGSGRKVNNQSV